MAFNRTLITAALPYANGPVHIGHLAGVYVPADIYARYLRLKGKETLFVCGSDEHGVPVTIRARKEGITTQQVVDQTLLCGVRYLVRHLLPYHLADPSSVRFGLFPRDV